VSKPVTQSLVSFTLGRTISPPPLVTYTHTTGLTAVFLHPLLFIHGRTIKPTPLPRSSSYSPTHVYRPERPLVHSDKR